MTKTTIKEALQRAAGNVEFVNREDIKRCIGCGNDRAEQITEGLDFIRFNRVKLYDVNEVAARIYDYTEVAL